MANDVDETQETARKANLYPDCGCKSPDACTDCPNCGMCVANVETCSCCGFILPEHDPVGYDPHVDISGG